MWGSWLGLCMGVVCAVGAVIILGLITRDDAVNYLFKPALLYGAIPGFILGWGINALVRSKLP